MTEDTLAIILLLSFVAAYVVSSCMMSGTLINNLFRMWGKK